MIISVFLEGALKNGGRAVVPLDVDDVKPDVDAITCSCRKELAVIYPFEKTNSRFVVIGIEEVIDKMMSMKDHS